MKKLNALMVMVFVLMSTTAFACDCKSTTPPVSPDATKPSPEAPAQ